MESKERKVRMTKNFHIQLLENIRINKENQKHFHDSIISELLTRLKDAIFADNWEIQVFQVNRLKSFENFQILWHHEDNQLSD